MQKPFGTHVPQFAFESAQVLPPPLPEQRPQVLGHFCVIKSRYDALLHNAAFAAQLVATSVHVVPPPGLAVVTVVVLQKLQVF